MFHEGGGGSSFPLTALRTKHLCRCRTSTNFVVVVILAVMVVAMEFFSLVTLNALTLSLVLQKMSI